MFNGTSSFYERVNFTEDQTFEKQTFEKGLLYDAATLKATVTSLGQISLEILTLYAADLEILRWL